MNVGSLFSGIGGIDLGLERAGMRVVWQAENDEFCRAVLRKRFPGVPCYEDVREIDGTAPAVELLCGGFPCQPVSLAGKGRAELDDRWLWPEFARIIGCLRPDYALLENVPGLLARGRGMGRVLGDLAALGYDAEWTVLAAADVAAPHGRERVWIVAYPDGRSVVEGRRWRGASEAGEPLADADSERRDWRPRIFGPAGWDESPDGRLALAGADQEGQLQQGWAELEIRGRIGYGRGSWATEPDVGRVAHGIPARLDRLAALGNAVVPQVAEWIGRRIMSATRPTTPSGMRGAP